MKKLNNFDEFILNESLSEQEFLDKEISKIKDIKSLEELKEYSMFLTMGGFMPLNPIDPIRSVLREKIYELRNVAEDKVVYDRYLINLEGERKDITLPPGAMY